MGETRNASTVRQTSRDVTSLASRRGQGKQDFHRRSTDLLRLSYLVLSGHMLPHFAIRCHIMIVTTNNNNDHNNYDYCCCYYYYYYYYYHHHILARIPMKVDYAALLLSPSGSCP